MSDEEKKETSEKQEDEKTDEKGEKIEKEQGDEKKETEEKPEKLEHLSPAQEREALIDEMGDKPPGKVEEEEPVEDETKVFAEETTKKEIEEPAKKEEPEIITEKIIVDGEEREIPLSDIIDAGRRSLQKESAADSRLEKATRLLKEAKESASLPEKKDEEQSIKDAEAYKQKIKELTEAIQYGEEGVGEKALQEIIEMGRQQAIPDTEKLVAQIKDELRVDQINERLQASPEDGGFADLTEDPRLTMLANQAIDAEIAAGKPYTWELCKKACQDVRDWVNLTKKEEDPPSDEVKDELQEKRERKKVIDEAKSANLKDVKLTKEPKPETASEIIAGMRKVRGQA